MRGLGQRPARHSAVLPVDEALVRVKAYPATPDGRYFVVRGRLWRKTNPALSAAQRNSLVGQLMDARRTLGQAASRAQRQAAREAVHAAKVALGERGPVWWADQAPDYNRKLVKNTPYAAWFEALGCAEPAAGGE